MTGSPRDRHAEPRPSSMASARIATDPNLVSGASSPPGAAGQRRGPRAHGRQQPVTRSAGPTVHLSGTAASSRRTFSQCWEGLMFSPAPASAHPRLQVVAGGGEAEVLLTKGKAVRGGFPGMDGLRRRRCRGRPPCPAQSSQHTLESTGDSVSPSGSPRRVAPGVATRPTTGRETNEALGGAMLTAQKPRLWRRRYDISRDGLPIARWNRPGGARAARSSWTAADTRFTATRSAAASS